MHYKHKRHTVRNKENKWLQMIMCLVPQNMVWLTLRVMEKMSDIKCFINFLSMHILWFIIRKIYLFCLNSGTHLLKFLEFRKCESDQGIFVMLMRWLLSHSWGRRLVTRRTSHVIRELEFSISPTHHTTCPPTSGQQKGAEGLINGQWLMT